MRLSANQLGAALSKGLAPVYFISGDEPLQSGEAADAVRQAARNAGYLSREVYTADSGFVWNDLLQSADELSIFSDRKIIDLRIPSGKPGTEGAKALDSYCQRLPEDTLLLITAGKLPSPSKPARWVQNLEKIGVFIQVWPLEGANLIQWLQRRMQNRGLQASQEVLRLLASRVEGNLLAAAQEIEKLYVLFGEGQLDSETVLDAVVDSSRFDVFKLVDSALSGQSSRTIKILRGLKAEGIAAPVVLWALARETRNIIKIHTALQQGQNKSSVFRKNQVWEKRQQIVNSAMKRLTIENLEKILLLGAKADRQIKGEQSGDCWETLMIMCLSLCGQVVMAETA